jgi:hypothetical protein
MAHTVALAAAVTTAGTFVAPNTVGVANLQAFQQLSRDRPKLDNRELTRIQHLVPTKYQDPRTLNLIRLDDKHFIKGESVEQINSTCSLEYFIDRAKLVLRETKISLIIAGPNEPPYIWPVDADEITTTLTQRENISSELRNGLFKRIYVGFC